MSKTTARGVSKLAVLQGHNQKQMVAPVKKQLI